MKRHADGIGLGTCAKSGTAVLIAGVALAFGSAGTVWGADESLASPDGRLAVSFASDARGMRWALARDGKPAVAPSRLGLVFARAKPLAEMRVTKVSRRSEDSTWENRLYRRRTVRDRFNEMTVELEETEPRAERMPIGATEAEPVARRLTLVFRAYDEGVAFRYVVPEQRAFECFQLTGEETEWRFPSAVTGWTTTYKSEFTSQEEAFVHGPIGAIAPERYVGSPVLVEMPAGTLGLCEAALANWAGMFFRAKADASARETVLSAALARLPPSEASVPDVAVIRRTPAASPWRVTMAGDDELDLLRKNDILVNLNPPPEPGLDFDWVKPGATSWDWWVESNNSISTDLELRLVDFAAEMGWPYHTIDGGWYGYGRRGPNHGPDVRLEPCAGFDLGRIVAHAREKGVGIFVWVHWMIIDDTGVEETFARLARWGVKGVKIDFINRQDQWIVNWYERVCRAAARHHVLVNFHGAYKPTGTERTWPNNVNREGIRGNEMNIFNSQNTPAHAATLPFTRFLIGPGDYTPGGFGNVFSKDFVPQTRRGHRYGDPTDRRPIWAEQMGTRAQALALSVAFDGPVTTLCDWPERYRGADGTEALRGLPTVWKSTEPLAGRCGEFYEVVRESPDGRFYLASFTAKARTASVKLDFLGDGEWTMRAYADDPARTPSDAKALRTVTRKVAKGDRIDFPLCDEGGLVAIFER